MGGLMQKSLKICCFFIFPLLFFATRDKSVLQDKYGKESIRSVNMDLGDKFENLSPEEKNKFILVRLDQTFKLLDSLNERINALDKGFDKKINDRFKVLEMSILLKLGGVLSSVIFVSVAVSFVAFAYINDYRLDFTNEQNNARFERLESISIQRSRSGDTQNLGVRETLRGKRGKQHPTNE